MATCLTAVAFWSAGLAASAGSCFWETGPAACSIARLSQGMRPLSTWISCIPSSGRCSQLSPGLWRRGAPLNRHRTSPDSKLLSRKENAPPDHGTTERQWSRTPRSLVYQRVEGRGLVQRCGGLYRLLQCHALCCIWHKNYTGVNTRTDHLQHSMPTRIPRSCYHSNFHDSIGQ